MPYSWKHSREKALVNFTDFAVPQKFSQQMFWGLAQEEF